MYKSPSGEWAEVPEARYANEAELHALLAEHPEILPIGDIEDGEPLTLVTVGRETALGSGYADLICVDAAGRVRLVEVKLLRNPEARREVVAQALSYAAYLEDMTVDDFTRQVWRAYAERYLGSDLATLDLPRGISRAAGVDVDPEGFLSGLGRSLEIGDFRILIVMDEPHPQLRRSVSYINRHADFEVYLVEVGFFRSDEGHQILNPRILDPIARSLGPDRGRRSWSLDEFKDIVGRNPTIAAPMSELIAELERLQHQGAIELALGTGVTQPSLKVQLPVEGKSILWVWPNGVINMPRYTLERLGIPPGEVTRLMGIIAEASGLPESAYATKAEPRLSSAEAFTSMVAKAVVEAIAAIVSALVATNSSRDSDASVASD